MRKLALFIALIGLTACGGDAGDTTDTAAGNVAPPPATGTGTGTGTGDTSRRDTTQMGDTTRRDTATARP